MDFELLVKIYGGFILILSAALGVFLKNFFNKTNEKMDKAAESISEVKLQIAGLSEQFKSQVLESFNAICKERRKHCGELQFDRLQHLENVDSNLCNKIKHLEECRQRAWEEQKRWNEKIEKKIDAK